MNVFRFVYSDLVLSTQFSIYGGVMKTDEFTRTDVSPREIRERTVIIQNVDDDSSISSTSSPKRTTTRGNSRSRKTCVTTTLVGIVLVLLLLGASCVPLILYFVEKGNNFDIITHDKQQYRQLNYNRGAHGPVVMGVLPVTEKALLQTPLWSIDVLC
uniref:Uncharacterized protein n=1 Tax=Magallana gigas TaxID=29159 RepID=K1Q2U2_MAGGI